MERRKPKTQMDGLYFKKPKPKSSLQFVSSGSTLLDLANGGGWPLGRMVNIIGDKSTGKTLLAIEAFANFHRQYPKGKMFYRESEAAFDTPYAESIGMPPDLVDFRGEHPKNFRWTLVEDVFTDLKEQARVLKYRKNPGIYVVDSLDALSTKIDMEREFGAQTYRTDKPSQMGELFRKLTAVCEEAQMLVIIISQVRAKIGVTFGEKTTRSGGAALDFYASIISKLAHLGQVQKTLGGVKRAVAVRVKAKNTKNKITDPFRECEFNIRFGYGINDAASCLEWLISVGRQNELDNLSKQRAEKLLKYLNDLDKEALNDWGLEIVRVTQHVWALVEQRFAPKVRKYV